MNPLLEFSALPRFADIRPASTMLYVAALLDDRWLPEVELDAIVD